MTSFFIRATELLIFCLPFIIALALIGIVGVATTALFRAQIARFWLKVCIRAVGSVLEVPLILAMMLILLMGACASRPRIIVSPDSQHVARYSYLAGFLGRDVTFVSVRKRWSLLSDDVYEDIGPSDWEATDVHWLNNHQLIIRYQPDPDGHHQECKREGAGIDVLCVTAVY
jgi:hypothetical protein